MKYNFDFSDVRNLINEKFGNINFVEEGHHYYIDDEEYIPVSNVISEYEPYVDWDEKAEIYARKHGRLKDDVQRDWKLTNLKSTISGTRTHEFGESYTWLKAGFSEKICEANRPQYVKEYNTLVSTYPKEDAIKKFYDELDNNIKPIGAEFKLSSKYIEGARKMCGTCDILFWDENLGGYKIYDWKTNKSLINDYNRRYNVRMKGCVDYMIDEPLSHYTMQFNLYQKMLESIGLNIIGRVLVWLKNDGTYETIDIEKMDDNILDEVIKKGEK